MTGAPIGTPPVTILPVKVVDAVRKLLHAAKLAKRDRPSATELADRCGCTETQARMAMRAIRAETWR